MTGPLGDAVLGRLRAALGPRYRIEREIGQGGMAVVYLAHDLRHDRQVALKVLRPELSAYVGVERFLREIHIAAQLNHPHILTLHDSGEADGLLFFVMPYVEGESLRQRLARQGALPIAEAVTVAGEIADGLAYAHDLFVVHRDIKPENILLAHGHAAIADFGIARALAGAGADTAITTTGMSPGTPVYMSPEQAAGDHTLDHRADIYSLGCVLHEMLTGRPPYPGPTPQALLMQHATEPVPSARATRSDVPESLDAAVRRALAKAPADRFQTAAEFRAALDETAAVAAAAGAQPRRGTTMRRRALVAIATLAVVAVAAVLLFRPSPWSPGPATRLRVVVRPFDDRTGNLGPLAARLTEAVNDQLQTVPALNVVAASAVAELRNAPLDSLRNRFHPDRLVTGSVEQRGDSVEARVEVLDPRSDEALATHRQVVPSNVNAVNAVADSLSTKLLNTFSSDLDRRRVHSAAAWRLVEQARGLSDDAQAAIGRGLGVEALRSLGSADSALRVARGMDAASDLIPVMLAKIAERRAFYVEYLSQVAPALTAGLPRPQDERSRALADLDALIRTHHGPPDALELRGTMRVGLYRQVGTSALLDSAIADYGAAAELDRHRASAWSGLATAYAHAGLYEQALLATQRAVEEDAFHLSRRQLLRSQFDLALLLGRFEDAGHACRTGFAEAPWDERFIACEVQLWSRLKTDRRTAAVASARVDSLSRREPGTLATALRTLWVAEILTQAGLGDSADRIARRAVAGAPVGVAGVVWQMQLLPEEAYLRILRHDPDSAIAIITAAVRLNPSLRRPVRTAPWFRSLHTDPRFTSAVGAPTASP